MPRATLPADIGGGLEAPVSRLSRHVGIGASSSGRSVAAVALEPVRAEACVLYHRGCSREALPSVTRSSTDTPDDCNFWSWFITLLQQAKQRAVTGCW